MPKGHVMTKQFVLRPMKDTMLDYTWRTNGREVLICPICKRNGTPRTAGDDKVIMLHKEIVSDFRAAHIVEFCEADNTEIRAALIRKEKARLYSFELAERRRAEKLARKTARHRKYLLDTYGQSMVEMALLLPFFCLLLFGTIDLGRLIQAHTRVSNAAHLAMRDVQNVENGNTDTAVVTSDVATAVQNNFPGITITISPAGSVVSNETVVITATNQFSMITPFVRNMVGVYTIKQVSTGTTLP